MIVALVVATTYWQAWAAGDLADRQDNQIQRVAQFTIERGEIRGKGLTWATNREEKKAGRTFFFREYPTRGLAAHVVGYSTQSRFRTGLERSLNDYLTGQNANLSTVLETFVDKAKGATIQGNDLRLTLVPRAQRAAQNALGRRCGAVVALDVRTGKVLTMYSSPTYDPNLVEESFDEVTSVRADCRRPDALLNRATAGLYAPGSTFKVVTAAAAIDSGRYTPDSTSSTRLLRGVRQAGEQLRHDAAVRLARPAHGARQLGQLRLLQHRQGARRALPRRVHEAVRLLREAAARDAGERTHRERPVQGHGALRPAGGQRGRPRPVRVRPGAAARDAAADGDGRRDDRQRRRRDGATGRRPDRRPDGSIVVRSNPTSSGAPSSRDAARSRR